MASTEQLGDVAMVRRCLREGMARDLRTAAGVSRAELARALGCGEVTVWRWETGRRSPRYATAVRLAAIYGAMTPAVAP